MTQLASILTGQLSSALRGEDGVNAHVAALALPASLPLFRDAGILELQAAADLAEQAGTVHYPVIHVCCDRIANSRKEKFRAFSGTADLTVEIRVSGDRLEALQQQLQGYVEAVTGVLDDQRGDWGGGVFYTGAYEVLFGPVKRGGRRFVQSARVQLQLNVQRD